MRILTKAAGAATYRSLIRTTGWTLRRKLILGLSVMMALFLIVAVYSLYEVGIIKSELKQQNEKVELKLMALELKELVQELNIIASGLEISKKTEYIPKYNEKERYTTSSSSGSAIRCRRRNRRAGGASSFCLRTITPAPSIRPLS
ncbi:hypothetical protein LJK88_34960 [Paenibacillus sp. P26]|nr:hypothetical protein LJK88_34960 [Paenibacillus sp. P26]